VLVYAFFLSGYLELLTFILGINITGLFGIYVPLLNGMFVGRDLTPHDAMSLFQNEKILKWDQFPILFRITAGKQQGELVIIKKRDELADAFWFLMRASNDQPIVICRIRNFPGVYVLRGILHLVFPLCMALLFGAHILYFTLVSTWWMLGACALACRIVLCAKFNMRVLRRCCCQPNAVPPIRS
jgi:hypothetical protein